MGDAAQDVIVVGAGSSGCVLAARLSEDPNRRVLLVECGDAGPVTVELFPGRRHLIIRGTGVGGSGLINGGYFERPRPTDFAGWARVAPGWDYEACLSYMIALERDLDFGARAEHGASGPVPVARPGVDHPIAAAFLDAALDDGQAFEADKNAGAAHGVGPIPMNIVDGVRWDMGTAYLAAALHRPNLQVIAGMVTRLLIAGRRVVGVVASHEGVDTELHAGEVVLAAGAWGTAQILQQSGVGPAAVLRDRTIDVVADLPVATAFSDHPQLRLDWVSPPLPPATLSLAIASNSADVEIMPILQPVAQAFPSSGVAEGVYSTLVTLESSQSRGRFELGRPPAYGYLSTAADVAALRAGVRDAARLMTSAPFRALGATLTDAPPSSDAELDAWIRANLGTAHHLSGTAPMGIVTDAAGRVHDLDGLRVGDISILPTTPSRGTALAAVLVAERIAAEMS